MTVDAIDAPARQGTFFGEPRPLAYLAFTEAWAREETFRARAGPLPVLASKSVFTVPSAFTVIGDMTICVRAA